MNNLLPKLITLVILGIFAFMIFYMSSRLRIHFNLPSKWLVIMTVSTILIGAMVLIFISVKSSSPIVGSLSILGGYILVFSIFLLMSLLLMQLVQPVLQLPYLMTGWIALALALIPTVIAALNASNFEVNERTVYIPKLDRSMQIMLITDVHLGHHRGKAYLEKIVEETNKRNPDIILLAGDLMDSEVALFPEILSPLAAFKAPAYYVSGNHEKAIDEQKALKLIAENAVQVLHNNVLEVAGLQIIGLDYMNADDDAFDMHPSDNNQTIKEVLNQLEWDRDKAVVLMHHSPVGINYAQDLQVDLFVAGHTHAGQVFPFTYLANFIFKYNKGLHKAGKTTVFVSQGAGTFLSRMRLGSRNEINLLNLVPAL